MRKEWYFVRKLRENESSGDLNRFEVQLLDHDGRAIATGLVGISTKELILNDHMVPNSVIKAALLKNEGGGDYVDKNGKSIPPF